MNAVNFLKIVALVVLVFVALAFFLGPGNQMHPTSFSPLPSPEFHGPFTVNSTLESAFRLFEKELPGAESLAIQDDGTMYTGLNDGRIIQIKDGRIKTITRLGGINCDMTTATTEKSNDNLCGRPLGMRIDSSGNLVVADIIKGIVRISPKTGTVTTLVPCRTMIAGKQLNIPNDLVISSKGDVYFTETSAQWAVTLWGLDAATIDIAENGANGRILHYDPRTKKVQTLIESIYTANGIELSAKEDFLMFAQLGRFNLLKYHLEGVKKGSVEIILDNLPGLPDNIRPSGRGTFWVALFAARLPGYASFLERMMNRPTQRCIVYSTLMFIIQCFDTLKFYFPAPIFDIITGELRDLIWNSFGDRTYGLVFEMMETGTVLRSFHSPKGRLNQISQVTEHQNVLYFSSPFNDYLGKLNLSK